MNARASFEWTRNFGPNFGPLTPELHPKPTNTSDQRARRINKIENLAKSAKPPSPVQSGRRLQFSLAKSHNSRIEGAVAASRSGPKWSQDPSRHEEDARSRQVCACCVVGRRSREPLTSDGADARLSTAASGALAHCEAICRQPSRVHARGSTTCRRPSPATRASARSSASRYRLVTNVRREGWAGRKAGQIAGPNGAAIQPARGRPAARSCAPASPRPGTARRSPSSARPARPSCEISTHSTDWTVIVVLTGYGSIAMAVESIEVRRRELPDKTSRPRSDRGPLAVMQAAWRG